MITGILIGDGFSKKNQWQTTNFKGKPLLKYPLEAMLQSRLDEVLLVLGRDYHLILNKIKIKDGKARLLMNHRFERGMSSYIRIAMSLLNPQTDAVLIALGEYPLLTSSLLNRMIEYFEQDKYGILIPQYEDEFGKPYIFDKKYFKYLSRLMGNQLGNTIINKFPSDVYKLEVKNPGVIKGIDRIQELESMDSQELERKEQAAASEDRPEPPREPLEKKSTRKEIEEQIAAKRNNKETREMKTDAGLQKPQKKNGSGSDISLEKLNDLLARPTARLNKETKSGANSTVNEEAGQPGAEQLSLEEAKTTSEKEKRNEKNE
ncbi:MAG: NTP transferase domain-containing protein [Vulcanimicrobiota bacterium]